MPAKIPIRTCVLVFLCLICGLSEAIAGPGSPRYLKMNDGIIIYPNYKLSGNTRMIRLRVVSENIIRVIASPGTELPDNKSLVVIDSQALRTKWDVQETTDKIILKTSQLIATADPITGAVSFTDSNGNPILSERETNGRQFEPAVFDGQASFHIRQTFETHPDEAIYGLGQHQDGLLNNKGRQVTLFQNNTEVAIPFFVSTRHYGILWDNYSLTTVGDIRPYKPLSALKLFSAHGEQGWLTATYLNDSSLPAVPVLVRGESVINDSYLGDSRMHFPSGFMAARGSVTWEGAISPEMTGQHVLHFTYAGYLKVWIDGRLMLDRWRQPWNPGSAILDLDLEQGKKVPVKIAWRPDGDESYLSLHWLGPVPDAQKEDFAFSSEAGRQLDYYFIYGRNMDEVISGYRRLTGQTPMIPKWALGFWQSRERYKTQDEILNTVREFRKRKIPLDNIVLDWSYWKQEDWGSQEFDPTRFPSPDSMILDLHQKYHAHFMISVWPKFYEGIPAYRAFDEKGWLYKRNIADRQRDWIGKGYVSTFYDAFNKDARQGFWDLLNKNLYSKGVDAWWMDASEPDILSNVSPEKRKEQMTPTALGPSAEYLNAYPLENAKGIYEGQRATGAERVLILTRSAFAGSQHYAAAVWSGDIAARWSDMRAQISAGLDFSMSGLPYWTMDIGGFSVERRYENAKGKDLDEWREQMTRWYQFGAFCPLFRVHGQYPYREIFNTAPEDHPAYRSMLYYDRLRYRLLPYMYSLAAMVTREDYTMMRGLAMDFPGDTAVYNIGDQYLFGPSLLINPVCNYEARSREVYLPAGQGWYDLYSGKYEPGGRRIVADAPYERIPVFVKEGSIIPFGPALQYSDEKPADPITLYVYTGKDVSFTLYEDENSNYNYEKGACSRIPISYNEASGTLIIGPREGSFPGMLTQRVFNIQWIGRKNARPLDPDAPAGATVHYGGERISVKRDGSMK